MGPHNPVSATCTLGKNKYTLTTYNAGQDKDDYREEKISECKKSDIVFFQEVNQNTITSFNDEFESFKNKLGNAYTAVLIKKHIIGEKQKRDENKKIPAVCEDVRHCTVEMTNMIVISWHGNQIINKKGTLKDQKKVPKDAKKVIFKALQRHAFDLVKESSLPVIIGGDFNIPVDELTQLETLPEECDHHYFKTPRKLNVDDNGTIRSDIDFFYVVLPNLLGIATPFLPHFKEGASASPKQDENDDDGITRGMADVKLGEDEATK